MMKNTTRKIKGFSKFDERDWKTYPDKSGVYLTLIYRDDSNGEFAFWDEFTTWNTRSEKFKTKNRVFAYKFVSELLSCLDIEEIHNKLIRKNNEV